MNLISDKNLIISPKNIAKKDYFQTSKDKNFTCPEQNCKRRFKEKGNLRTHYRIHVRFVVK